MWLIAPALVEHGAQGVEVRQPKPILQVVVELFGGLGEIGCSRDDALRGGLLFHHAVKPPDNFDADFLLFRVTFAFNDDQHGSDATALNGVNVKSTITSSRRQMYRSIHSSLHAKYWLQVDAFADYGLSVISF